MEPYVHRSEPDSGVVFIEFFHPAHNSLPGKPLGQLAQEITDAGSDDAVQVIVLQSGGNRTFCAGASFDELIGINDLEAGKEFFSGFAHVINACRKSSKLIVGRVQGKAVGGGVGLAAATDYCLATQHASIKLSELNIGIGPFVIAPAVKRKTGLSAFTTLTLNPDRFYPADWAKANGLFQEVYEETAQLDEAVNALAQKLSATNPEARRQLKQVLWEGTEHWDQLLAERAAMSGKLVLSDFTKTALKKYQ